MEFFMKYKVHWLIDGLVEIDANDVDTAESVIKNKIESFIKDNDQFFKNVGAKAVQGQAYLPGSDEKNNGEA
tara:strand:- start:201 stop:416 length:216 start_codon:yes stop_codon:yes gene_type:complete